MALRKRLGLPFTLSCLVLTADCKSRLVCSVAPSGTTKHEGLLRHDHASLMMIANKLRSHAWQPPGSGEAHRADTSRHNRRDGAI